MRFEQVQFVKSAQKVNGLPAGDRAEYAFLGRSNVGKSSLINALCGHKGLAKTSSTPGKTQLINVFAVNDWYLTDLPGYGYAKVSQRRREVFAEMIQQYVLRRRNLVSVFLLVDSRIPPQQSDLDFMEFMGVNEIPFVIVFTKLDKLKQSEREKNIKAYREKLFETWEELPPIVLSSSKTKEGLSELKQYIEDTKQYAIKA